MFSVVIPLYNKGPHINETLNSVLVQKLQPSEIIVVDDGSSDNGPEVVKAFTHHGVRLIHQTNQGVSAARNLGLNEAVCKYVAFLDADDLWQSNHLEQLSILIERFPDAGLYSTAHQIRRDGMILKPQNPFEAGWSGLVEDFFSEYSIGFALVNSSTACVRRDALIAAGGFPVGESRGEDIVAWIKLALSYPVAHYNVATVVYNQDAVSRTNELRDQDTPVSLRYLAQLIKEKDSRCYMEKGLYRFFDRIAFFTAAGFCLEGDRLGAKKITDLATRTGRYFTAGAITLLRLMPSGLLRIAKRCRHEKI
jgi:glycosyltransferase involved in cell wall biosynthesis